MLRPLRPEDSQGLPEILALTPMGVWILMQGTVTSGSLALKKSLP